MVADLDEPAAVDDVYISVENGIGQQPVDRPSVMAGFVCAVRLHMIIERLCVMNLYHMDNRADR